MRTESDLIAKIIQLSKSRSRESLSLSRSIMGESKDLQSLATEIIEKLNAWNKPTSILDRPRFIFTTYACLQKPDLIILLKIDFYFCNHFVSVIYVGFQNLIGPLAYLWLVAINPPIRIELISIIFSRCSLYIFRMEEIFLKIALAESDGAFESVLGKYLPQVIESLETNQQKALEIITHVKKRVTSRPEWDKIMTSSLRYYWILRNWSLKIHLRMPNYKITMLIIIHVR